MKKYQKNTKRILLKLSWEALQWSQGYGIDPNFLAYLAEKIVSLVQKDWFEIAIVVGGGNIFRGVELQRWGFDRATGDNMGMLATIINGIAVGEAIETAGVPVRVMSAIPTHKVAEDFIQRRALRHIEKGRVVIAVGGSGNPFFSTDSAAVLRALELQCDVVVKATKVDGIYDKDPMKHDDATRYDLLSLEEAIQKNVRVMDQAAIALAHDECMPIYVCKIDDVDKIASDGIVGTYVCTRKEKLI